MEITALLFWICSLILIVSSIKVITAKNAVHAVLALVLCFFQTAFIWMLLNAEFLAITLILVYVGAVMVLFLFVVMMLDLGTQSFIKGFKRYFLIGGGMAGFLIFQMAVFMYKGFYIPLNASSISGNVLTMGQTKALGLNMFTHYAFAVEVASVILLVAVIAAISLTLRHRKDGKYYSPHKAVHTQSNNRINLVKVKSVSNSELSTVAYPINLNNAINRGGATFKTTDTMNTISIEKSMIDDANGSKS